MLVKCERLRSYGYIIHSINRQRQDVKTRSGDLANLGTESEVIVLKTNVDEALKLLRLMLICLLIALLIVLIK